MRSENLFRETFDQIRAPEALAERVMAAAKEQGTGRRSAGKIGRAVLVAAVLVCVLAVGAAAGGGIAAFVQGDGTGVVEAIYSGGSYASGDGIVEYTDWGSLDGFIPAWDRGSVDPELAQQLAAFLYTLEENTVTRGGFTYTIHAVLYDAGTGAAVVYWSVENPDGLGDYAVDRNGKFCTLESSGMYAVCMGRTYLDEENSTDTKLYLSSYGLDWGEELWCEFGCRTEGERDSQRIIIPADDRGGMACITLDETAVISPVALKLMGWHGDDVDEVTITFRDGSEYVLVSEALFVDNATYAGTQADSTTYTFNRIIDVGQIACVTVNGTVYSAG